jgi:hypothetical protein
MDANSGRWEFFPLQDGRTLLVYTQWSDMDSLGFTMRMMFRAQPDLRLAFPVATTTLVVEAIRRRAEGLPVTEPAPVTAPVSQPEIPLLSDPQSPVPLDALRFLSRSGTVIVIHPRQWIQTRAGPLDLVFVSSTAHVKTSAYTAQYYTRQFARYPEFFNQVRQTVHRNTAAGEFVDWELGLGFGFLAVGINFTLTYDEDPNGAILRYRTHAGDIEHVYGAWEWISLGEQESLAVYTTVSELGPDAPAIMKLVNLVPNRKITVGVSSSAIIAEKIRPWIEAQPAVTLQAD